MTQSTIKNFQEFEPQNGDAPDSLVLLLHGLGSNGRDLISLAPLWAKSLPGTVFISPEAPEACDMVPPGYPESFQWFSLQTRDPDALFRGAQNAAPVLWKFMDEQRARFGLPAHKVALVGFSQGTMMSLYAGPRYQEKIAGILGYSGALIGGAPAGPQTLHKMPVHLIHGEHDDVVPIAAYHAAREALEHNGYSVSGHTTPFLQHSIDQKGLESGAGFLRSLF
ncbi:MAG: phospholipase [Alphaproteobacteria bacterium]|nr:phospholipase [Alphaproteobacteria bacterium]